MHAFSLVLKAKEVKCIRKRQPVLSSRRLVLED